MGGCSTPRPGCCTPEKVTRYLFYRRLRGPQGRFERMRKTSPPTGIRYPDHGPDTVAREIQPYLPSQPGIETNLSCRGSPASRLIAMPTVTLLTSRGTKVVADVTQIESLSPARNIPVCLNPYRTNVENRVSS